MPTYEYKCESCGIHFDKVQHFKDEPLKACPECGGLVHRLIHPVGIIFKGSGFYVTDHRSSSSMPAPLSKTDAPEKAEVSGETGNETTSSANGGSEAQASREEAAD